MITRDYVLRMVSLLVKVLQRMLGLKEAHNLVEARKELDAAYRSLLGVSPDFVRSFSDAQLIELVGNDSQTKAVRCYVLGVLLKEESELAYLSHRQERADELCAKALSLLLTAFLESPSPLDTDHQVHIEGCIRLLQGSTLPPLLLEKLFDYYGRTSRYDKAEDVLFELLPLDERYRAMGISFFETLLDKSNEEIAAGGLTREEINETLATMKKGTF
ncbi:MAG TPA: DUF6483 family protein [Bacteroidota bacterium]|nr:DUF6483 family protein [Bacteroidota bacterium]